MKICQSWTFKNSHTGLPSPLQNHWAGFGCPCCLAEESFSRMNEELQGGTKACCDLAEQEGRLSPVLCQRCPSVTIVSPEQAWGQTPFLRGHLGACVWVSGLGSGLVPIWCGGVNVFVFPAQALAQLSHQHSSPGTLPSAADTHSRVFQPLQQLIWRNTPALCGIS